MKVFKFFVGIILIGGLSLFGLKMYTANQHSEFAGIMDQLNPLVTEGEVYVKTKKPDAVNSYGTATYIQEAVDKNGKKRTVEFNGIGVLKEERYLKLTNKGAHVETYEEVDKNEVPEKALALIG